MFNFQNFFIRRTLNKRLNEIERRARRKATAEARKRHAQAQAEGRILLRTRIFDPQTSMSISSCVARIKSGWYYRKA